MEPASGIVVSELSSPSSSVDNSGDSENHNSAAKLDAALGDNRNQISIYCIYTANPSELLANSTRWFKDGLPLNTIDNNNNRHRYSESFTPTGYPVLTINQVNRRDAGYYDCQVANSVGLSERLSTSDACKVEVNFRPTVRMRLFRLIDQQKRANHLSAEDIVEADLNQELILPGNSYVFMCDIVEAQPNKIQKFYWFKRPIIQQQQNRQQDKNNNNFLQQEQEQLLSITELNQFVINSLNANFTSASYACSASNSLGVSDNSNRIDLQLSYSPGKFKNKFIINFSIQTPVHLYSHYFLSIRDRSTTEINKSLQFYLFTLLFIYLHYYCLLFSLSLSLILNCYDWRAKQISPLVKMLYAFVRNMVLYTFIFSTNTKRKIIIAATHKLLLCLPSFRFIFFPVYVNLPLSI